jgi:hypothetical protein
MFHTLAALLLILNANAEDTACRHDKNKDERFKRVVDRSKRVMYPYNKKVRN